MNPDNKLISRGFILAGLMNMSVLIFSRFFTNPTITEFDPDVMSNFGLLVIVIWGLAYMAITNSYIQVKWLVGVFAIEKLLYGINWLQWLFNSNISEVYQKDTMAGIFFSIYGLNDWLFFLFFLLVFIKIYRIKDIS